MRTRTVRLPGREYNIRIGGGILREMGAVLAPLLPPGGTVAVVSDETVWGLYGGAVTAALLEAGYAASPVILPPGEGSKSLAGLGTVYGAFARMGLQRAGMAVALGGGVIGDLCGFAAATWMRGIRYVQVPTTLLAMVDSSVGGKTAVNLPEGKNLAGAFWQPAAVLADTDTLATLPPREMRSGMAEVIKYGAIRSAELLETLERPPAAADLTEIIDDCCGIKAEIVARDEHDHGERMLLNFGHTFGHAIEKLGDFSGYSHGEAVALGMVMAAVVGEYLNETQPGTSDILREVLAANGLQTRCPYRAAQLLPNMRGDKKSDGDGVSLVLLRRPGEAMTERVTYELLGEVMREVESAWTTQG